jgi:YgiT-type zinc finger domain-containing protein
MDSCPACGQRTLEAVVIDRSFQRADGRWVLIEHLPALVCDRCGETLYSEADTARIHAMLLGQEPPTAFRSMPVFDFEAPAKAKSDGAWTTSVASCEGVTRQALTTANVVAHQPDAVVANAIHAA